MSPQAVSECVRMLSDALSPFQLVEVIGSCNTMTAQAILQSLGM